MSLDSGTDITVTDGQTLRAAQFAAGLRRPRVSIAAIASVAALFVLFVVFALTDFIWLSTKDISAVWGNLASLSYAVLVIGTVAVIRNEHSRRERIAVVFSDTVGTLEARASTRELIPLDLGFRLASTIRDQYPDKIEPSLLRDALGHGNPSYDAMRHAARQLVDWLVYHDERGLAEELFGLLERRQIEEEGLDDFVSRLVTELRHHGEWERAYVLERMQAVPRETGPWPAKT